jgi:hypothetical protein
MKYFKQKPTVGSRLVEASEPIVSDEQRLRSLIESHYVMKKVRESKRALLPLKPLYSKGLRG